MQSVVGQGDCENFDFFSDVSWTALLAGFTSNQDSQESRNGKTSSETALTTDLCACAHVAAYPVPGNQISFSLLSFKI